MGNRGLFRLLVNDLEGFIKRCTLGTLYGHEMRQAAKFHKAQIKSNHHRAVAYRHENILGNLVAQLFVDFLGHGAHTLKEQRIIHMGRIISIA